MTWKKYLPFLAWPSLTPALARAEAASGLTVAWIVIPQGIAYAMLAGMPPITGIYMALLPALVAVMWGSSPRLATGPAALTCVLVGSSIHGLLPDAEQASALWVQYALWIGLLAACMQLLLGVIKFGWMINLVSSPVMSGFTQAAACLIIASQVPSLLGIKQLSDVLDMSLINVWSAAFSLGTLMFLWATRHLSKKIPWILFAIVGAAVLSYLSNYSSHSAVVGAIPTALPSLNLPQPLAWDVLQTLLLPAAMVALVSFLEVASSAKVEHQTKGTRWDDNQDLIGQGLAKLSAVVLGAPPTSGSFSRSALTLFAGAQTGWATVFMLLFATVLWQLGAGIFAYVPKAVLAGVIVIAVSNLLKPKVFKQLWLTSKTEAMIAGFTFLATLYTAPNLYWGVFLGVLISLSHFLYQRLHPRMIEVGLHSDGSIRDRILWLLPPLGNGVYAMRMDAALDFASAASFERRIFAAIAQRPDIKHVCVFAQPINWIDATGLETLTQIHLQLASRGITLHLSGLKLPLEKVFERAQVLNVGTYLKKYRSENETIAALSQI